MKCSPFLNPCAQITSYCCTQIPQSFLCKGGISPNAEPLSIRRACDKIVIIVVLNTSVLHHVPQKVLHRCYTTWENRLFENQRFAVFRLKSKNLIYLFFHSLQVVMGYSL